MRLDDDTSEMTSRAWVSAEQHGGIKLGVDVVIFGCGIDGFRGHRCFVGKESLISRGMYTANLN